MLKRNVSSLIMRFSRSFNITDLVDSMGDWLKAGLSGVLQLRNTPHAAATQGGFFLVSGRSRSRTVFRHQSAANFYKKLRIRPPYLKEDNR
jgi:hypothetical protein